jgi:nicotinic acid mononucleotide adenylyltransferase
MKSFLTFFEQAEDQSVEMNKPKRVSDTLVSLFGRHNPPHIGHKLTFDKADDIAGNEEADQRFYTSRTQDKKKNPLPYEVKLDHLQRMFPEHSEKWDDDKNIDTVIKTAQKAHQDGYKNFHFIGGGDRYQDIDNLLRKYNGNMYDFKNIYAHNAGDRNIGDFISHISASKQRNHAENDDFDAYNQGILNHKGYTEDDSRELFNLLKKIQSGDESDEKEIRDRYVQGSLFAEGDIVESLIYGLVGSVHRRGANHLICVTEDGIMFKSFLEDVIPYK